VVRRNDRGYRIGESRRNCTIPDAMVIRIRNLREIECMEIPAIARLVQIPEGTVKSICLYRRRRHVYIEIPSEDEEEGR